MCASAMLNLMCGASKERVARLYPTSATANASAVRPASAAMAASAHAVSLPTIAGRSANAKLAEASLAASGRSMANQYTVKSASIQLRARPAVVREASSMSLFARTGLASAHSMLLARRYVSLAWSSSVNPGTETLASTASASSPRLSHDNACATDELGLRSSCLPALRPAPAARQGQDRPARSRLGQR